MILRNSHLLPVLCIPVHLPPPTPPPPPPPPPPPRTHSYNAHQHLSYHTKQESNTIMSFFKCKPRATRHYHFRWFFIQKERTKQDQNPEQLMLHIQHPREKILDIPLMNFTDQIHFINQRKRDESVCVCVCVFACFTRNTACTYEIMLFSVLVTKLLNVHNLNMWNHTGTLSYFNFSKQSIVQDEWTCKHTPISKNIFWFYLLLSPCKWVKITAPCTNMGTIFAIIMQRCTDLT